MNFVANEMATGTNNSANGIDIKLNKLCRVCSVPNTKMRKLFEENQKIINEIEFCTGVLFKEAEGLPEQICKTCLENLSIAHNFKTQCLLSVQTYEKVIIHVKEELLEENLDDCKLEIKSEIGDSSITHDTSDFDDISIKPECQPTSKIQDSKPKPKKVRGPYKKKSGQIGRLENNKFTKRECQPCIRTFQSAEASPLHNQDCHNISWICEFCGKKFAHRSSHHIHIMSHLPPRYCCDHCDYRTSSKNDLIKHIKIHFGIRNNKCRQCPLSFTSVSNQLDHERRCHNKMKRFSCTVCNKAFYEKACLSRHIDSHNSVKRFKCEVCDTLLSQRKHWKRHMLKQHNIAVPLQRSGRKRGQLTAIEL